jgi:hypothetical protein
LDPGTSVCGFDGGQLERKLSYVGMSSFSLASSARLLMKGLDVASDARERSGGDGKNSFQDVCCEWVNSSCFLARRIGASLNDGCENRCKYASIDILQVLERDLPLRTKAKQCGDGGSPVHLPGGSELG